MNGFVSLSAGAKEGTFETKTLYRTSGWLEINLSTSVGGKFKLRIKIKECDLYSMNFTAR